MLESERENGPFQGHPTSDCYVYYLFDFFSGLLKGVVLGLYQRSWVKVAVGGILVLDGIDFSGRLTKNVQLLYKLERFRLAVWWYFVIQPSKSLRRGS